MTLLVEVQCDDEKLEIVNAEARARGISGDIVKKLDGKFLMAEQTFLHLRVALGLERMQ